MPPLASAWAPPFRLPAVRDTTMNASTSEPAQPLPAIPISITRTAHCTPKACRCNCWPNALGTPLYVYSRAALHAAWESYREAIASATVLVCYGMKANSNLAVLKEFARLGAGFDIVSGGELHRVLAAGARPGQGGVLGRGQAGLGNAQGPARPDVKCFNVESEAELRRLSDVGGFAGQDAPAYRCA